MREWHAWLSLERESYLFTAAAELALGWSQKWGNQNRFGMARIHFSCLLADFDTCLVRELLLLPSNAQIAPSLPSLKGNRWRHYWRMISAVWMPAIDSLHRKESMWFISPWLQIQFSIPMSRNWLNAMTNANSAAIWYARAPSAQRRRRRRTTFVHISHFAACYAKCSGKKHSYKKLLIQKRENTEMKVRLRNQNLSRWRHAKKTRI